LPRDSNDRNWPGRFDARLGDRLIVERSRTPFFESARVLLGEGLAAPGDMLEMRHDGSEHVALRAAVGVAAKLTVSEVSGPPRLVSWKPMPSRDRGIPMR
jgi:hypothetical protein